jgi:hypothetical protein
MSYGIILWGNSSYSSAMFKMQKRVIRIMMGCGYRESCRELFKELKILPLSSQYTFSLLLFVVNNRDYFVSNSAYHSNNTRQRNYLHLLWVTLTMCQKEFIIQASKYSTLFARRLRISPANLIRLKLP